MLEAAGIVPPSLSDFLPDGLVPGGAEIDASDAIAAGRRLSQVGGEYITGSTLRFGDGIPSAIAADEDVAPPRQHSRSVAAMGAGGISGAKTVLEPIGLHKTHTGARIAEADIVGPASTGRKRRARRDSGGGGRRKPRTGDRSGYRRRPSVVGEAKSGSPQRGRSRHRSALKESDSRSMLPGALLVADATPQQTRRSRSHDAAASCSPVRSRSHDAAQSPALATSRSDAHDDVAATTASRRRRRPRQR